MKYLNLKKIIAGLFVCLIITGGLFAQGSKNEDLPKEKIEREFSKGERTMREDFAPEAKRPRPPRSRPADEDMGKRLNPKDLSEDEEKPARPKMRKDGKTPRLEGLRPDGDNARQKMLTEDMKAGDELSSADGGNGRQGRRMKNKLRSGGKMELSEKDRIPECAEMDFDKGRLETKDSPDRERVLERPDDEMKSRRRYDGFKKRKFRQENPIQEKPIIEK